MSLTKEALADAIDFGPLPESNKMKYTKEDLAERRRQLSETKTPLGKISGPHRSSEGNPQRFQIHVNGIGGWLYRHGNSVADLLAWADRTSAEVIAEVSRLDDEDNGTVYDEVTE